MADCQQRSSNPLKHTDCAACYKLLREGDRVWVRVPGEGFVGVGIVKGPMQYALDFKVATPQGPRPAMDVLTGGTYHREFLNDPERSEYFVPIGLDQNHARLTRRQ